MAFRGGTAGGYGIRGGNQMRRQRGRGRIGGGYGGSGRPTGGPGSRPFEWDSGQGGGGVRPPMARVGGNLATPDEINEARARQGKAPLPSSFWENRGGFQKPGPGGGGGGLTDYLDTIPGSGGVRPQPGPYRALWDPINQGVRPQPGPGGGGGVRPLWDPINDGGRPQPGPGGGGGGPGGGGGLLDWFRRQRGRPTEKEDNYPGMMPTNTGNRLSDAYSKAYNEALKANIERYEDILGQYGERLDKGMEAMTGAERLAESRYGRMEGDVSSDMVSRGITGTASAQVAKGLVGREKQFAMDDIARQRADLRSGMHKQMLDFMERKKESYPSQEQYLAMQQAFGRYGFGGGGGGGGGGRSRGVSHASMSNPSWRGQARQRTPRYPTINEPGGGTSGWGSGGYYGADPAKGGTTYGQGYWHDPFYRATPAEKASAVGSMNMWGIHPGQIAGPIGYPMYGGGGGGGGGGGISPGVQNSILQNQAESEWRRNLNFRQFDQQLPTNQLAWPLGSDLSRDQATHWKDTEEYRWWPD